MSSITKTIYKCDICGKESEEKKLHAVDVPVKAYDCEGRSWSKGFRRVDMCDRCYEAFWNVSQDYFAEVSDCYGIKVDEVLYKEAES